MIILGIDIGLTGAIAKLNHRGQYAGVLDMPVMQRGAGTGTVKNQINVTALAELLREAVRGYDKNEVQVFIERVQPMPAVKATPGKGRGFQILQGAGSTFSLGHTAGAIEATVIALGFTHHLVAPTDWKRALKLKAAKEQARALAIRLFPDAPLARKRDHNRAEALLIAKYGYEKVIAKYGYEKVA